MPLPETAQELQDLLDKRNEFLIKITDMQLLTLQDLVVTGRRIYVVQAGKSKQRVAVLMGYGKYCALQDTIKRVQELVNEFVKSNPVLGAAARQQ